jgi:hypothetical protein
MSTAELDRADEATEATATQLTVITDAASLTLQNVETQMAAFKNGATKQIAAINEEYGHLKADVNDPVVCEKIVTGHKAVKQLRSEIEKTRKFFKTPINVLSKSIDGTARWCIEELNDTADNLASERKIIDAEKLRIKEEKQRKAEAQLQDRVEKMTAVNSPVDILQLRVMSPATFAETLAEATSAHETAEAEKAELAKLRAEAEELHRKEQAELAKLRAEAEELHRKEQERLKVEQTEREETQRIRDAEQAELQKLRNKAAEHERLEQERLQKDKDDEAARIAEEAEKLRQEEAEAAKLKQKEEDAKAAKKAARANKKRQEELRPQIDFLNNYATRLDELQSHDEFYMPEDHPLYGPVRDLLETAAGGVKELAANLS